MDINTPNQITADDNSSNPDARPETPASESESELSLEEQQRYALFRSLRKEGGAEQFVRSISQQLLLQNDSNWGELLGAAPAALCCLGQTFVAATSSAAISSLELPMNGSLQRKTLRANLVHCSDLGRKAFMEAESKMQRVSMITNAICQPNGTIDKILRLIDNDKLARVDLQRQLDRLKGFSEDCVKDAKDVESKFKAWQDYAMEIRGACVSKDDNLVNERRTVQDNIGFAKAQKSHQEEQMERTKTEVETMMSHVKIHQDAYQHAQKALPRGWNLLAQQFAGDFMENAFGMLSQIGSLKSMITKNFYPYQSYDNGESHYSKMLPNPNDDYGFTIAGKISKHLHGLKTCLWYGDFVAPDYGVDWNTLHGFYRPMLVAYQPPSGSIDITLNVFKEARDRNGPFTVKENTNSRSSREAVEVLEIAIQVAEEIHADKESQRSIQNSTQPRDVGKIRGWREKIRMACERIDSLEDQRQSEMQLFAAQLNEAKEKSGKRPKKAAKRWDNLKFARDNYAASQKALEESEKRLSERAAREAEGKKKFNEIQLELARLSNEDLNMEQIVLILKKCVDRLTDFQEHLGKLIQFFDSLNNFIDLIHKDHAKEFLAQVNNIMEIDASNEHEAEHIRRADKKYLADSLLIDALQLRGYYLVAGELATVYVEVSRKHIMPGVNVIDKMSISPTGNGSKAVEQSKVKAIQAYARKAQSEINALAAKRQAAIRKELFDQEREFEEIGYMIKAAENEMVEQVEDDEKWDSE